VSRKSPKKNKPKLYANILCDNSYKPYKMIVTDGIKTMEIEIKNTSLKNAIGAAKDVYGVDEILTSRVMEG